MAIRETDFNSEYSKYASGQGEGVIMENYWRNFLGIEFGDSEVMNDLIGC